MIRTKRVAYTLPKDLIHFIDWYSKWEKLSKSKLVLLCIEEGFELFEDELNEGEIIDYHSKKIKNTIPFTITLPINVIEKLDYFHEKMIIPKSHLVVVSITLLLEKINQQIDDDIKKLMESSEL
jgi:hypothetical protein